MGFAPPREYGHQLHVWDLSGRRHLQALDLGSQHQMVLELRPSHEPNNTFGFVGVVVSTADLSASIWHWHRINGRYAVEKVIEIPAEPADPDELPDPLKPFSAVPPLVTDIDLSLDDRSLYVSCWGTGEFCRYDVSDPFHPQKTGSVRLGGIVSGVRTRPPARSPAGRRWSRRAATAGGSMSPTRSTAHGTRSSTRRACRAGW